MCDVQYSGESDQPEILKQRLDEQLEKNEVFDNSDERDHFMQQVRGSQSFPTDLNSEKITHQVSARGKNDNLNEVKAHTVKRVRFSILSISERAGQRLFDEALERQRRLAYLRQEKKKSLSNEKRRCTVDALERTGLRLFSQAIQRQNRLHTLREQKNKTRKTPTSQNVTNTTCQRLYSDALERNRRLTSLKEERMKNDHRHSILRSILRPSSASCGTSTRTFERLYEHAICKASMLKAREVKSGTLLSKKLASMKKCLSSKSIQKNGQGEREVRSKPMYKGRCGGKDEGTARPVTPSIKAKHADLKGFERLYAQSIKMQLIGRKRRENICRSSAKSNSERYRPS